VVRRGGGRLRREKRPSAHLTCPNGCFKGNIAPALRVVKRFRPGENGSRLEGEFHLLVPRALKKVRIYFERRS